MLVLLLVLGCATPPPAVPLPKPTEPARCAAPVEGSARLTDVGATRGLTEPSGDARLSAPGTGTVLAEDLDLDGDIDVVATTTGSLLVLLNDGHGQLAQVGELNDVPTTANLALIDADEDGLPDIWFWGTGIIVYGHNRGDGTFEAPVPVWTDVEGDARTYLALAWGDVDGDGDLDVLAPTMGTRETGSAPTRLLRNDDGVYVEIASLTAAGADIYSQAPMFTDIDHDGDLDPLIFPDITGPTTLWRNDGVVAGAARLSDVAPGLGFAVELAGMGMDNADLNADGVLDYCVSDVGPTLCFLSAAGLWFEASAALGATPAEWVDDAGTVGWSVELVDLDNDGFVELVQASGASQTEEADGPTGPIFPDLLYWGSATGFTDVTAATGFGDTTNHVGMAAADLTGDGFWDLLLANPMVAPKLWDNPCGAGAWLDVDLWGPPANRQGIGARVEVDVNGVTLAREIHGLRSHGQGPSMAHFGLGDTAAVDAIRVYWTDGSVTESGPTPTRQQVRLEYP